ncbi:hypothetical protein M438DRAFT_26027 [Aureobasidium pullulans EXF-150]|uniref:Uncharacterized protein n=1 Tax=Aureobasidium pullulans EXF-150 TaxID=1043002 RepID=A0A074XPP9_AURPU|nr:uncharacterized protein M438DRAFT_26027 [Aureobasidium pullulans EXF-150]KEQ83957.1 hypothetical protein M438DRAFT_26027 [Aureobasidium pullulans EXF-150]
MYLSIFCIIFILHGILSNLVGKKQMAKKRSIDIELPSAAEAACKRVPIPCKPPTPRSWYVKAKKGK